MILDPTVGGPPSITMNQPLILSPGLLVNPLGLPVDTPILLLPPLR